MKNKSVLTWTGGGGTAERHPYWVQSSRTTSRAFTMAEILLSLTIIGVVAAITLPSLTGNINERTWNTQRKALYARMSQAIALMPALNGYGTLTEDADHNVTADTAAETFVTEGLSKVLKINNICDSEHIADCGLVSNLTTLGGSVVSFPTTLKEFNPMLASARYSTNVVSAAFSLIDTKVAAFETQNGESIAVYYNPRCIGSLQENSSLSGDYGFFIGPKMCANFVYDLNGSKGPNTVGKDIGVMTVFYPYDAMVVAPYPATKPLTGTYDWNTALKKCTELDSEYRLPNMEETAAIFVNKGILGGIDGASYWTSSATYYKPEVKWFIQQSIGTIDDMSKDYALNVWCVKR